MLFSNDPVKNSRYFDLKNLEYLGVNLDDVRQADVMHEKNGKRLIRLLIGIDYRILFESTQGESNEFLSYKLLQKHGIPTLPVYSIFENEEIKLLLMEDLGRSENWDAAYEPDASSYDFGHALGKWYSEFHEKGLQAAGDPDAAFLRRETDELSPESIMNTARLMELTDYGCWKLAADNFCHIQRAIDKFEETLNYNDFSYENAAKSADGGVVMFDYHLLGRGYRYSDIRNVLSGLQDDAREGFLNGYGSYNEAEKLVDDVVSHLYSLQVASTHKRIPKWAADSIEAVESGQLEKSIDDLMRSV